MGRYSLTVGAVMADALVSGITWVGQISPAALCLTLLTSGFGVIMAANKIADGIFCGEEQKAA